MNLLKYFVPIHQICLNPRFAFTAHQGIPNGSFQISDTKLNSTIFTVFTNFFIKHFPMEILQFSINSLVYYLKLSHQIN